MSDFSILVKNKSGDSRAYFLFVEAPSVSGGAQVFQNVYVAAPPVPNNSGTAKFSMKKDFYAVTGTNPGQALGTNVTVTTGDFEIAKINQGGKMGTSAHMTAGTTGKGAEFDDSLLEQKCSTPGSFSIQNDTSFQLGNGCKPNMDHMMKGLQDD